MRRLIIDSSIVGLALFAMFFGAGNIIFPPFIGLIAGKEWPLGFAFYYMADVGLALVAIIAMLRSQTMDKVEGIMFRLGNIPAKLMMGAAVFCIGPLLAIPRTAVISYEMAIMPVFPDMSPIVAIVIYFILVFFFSIKESALVDLVGKVLTPALVIGLLAMITMGVVNPIGPQNDIVQADNLIWTSVISGYQTLDVLAALIFGLIVINALKARGYTEGAKKNLSVLIASCVACSILLVIYGGLCYLGSTVSTMYPPDVQKGDLVIKIAHHLFGAQGAMVLGTVVLLACLTTAIALVGAAGTFFSTLSHGRLPYRYLIIGIVLFSIGIANFGLNTIIAIAEPILIVIYPGALVVVFLSLFNDHIKNDNVFRYATFGAVVVSLCEAMNNLGAPMGFIKSFPLHEYGFSWVIPAVALGIIGAFIKPGNTHNVS